MVQCDQTLSVRAPSVMAFPATTPTGIMAYGMPPQVSSMMMTQPTMMYSQPANPFGPNPGAQVMDVPPSSPELNDPT
ncbi:hypothetical protein PBY51_003372 [Eleginops maclovinus]|uniref:Uncharacterized protein n=1 Tax=Eleginops maclovinus TaxID=56733 RepID=A0AAN7XC23_ELEMC|nr:hypothetical protein PBY51_003372 [Eleginops maclovinus]